MDGRAGIYRMDLATGEVLDVIEAEPLALAVLGENVYYLDSADNLLYSYHTVDGTILQAVEGVPMRFPAPREYGAALRHPGGRRGPPLPEIEFCFTSFCFKKANRNDRFEFATRVD